MIETGWCNIIIIIKAVFLTDKDSVLKNEITWQEYHELCVCVCVVKHPVFIIKKAELQYTFLLSLWHRFNPHTKDRYFKESHTPSIVFLSRLCAVDLINHFVESNRIGDALEILCGKKCVVWTRPMTWWLSRQSPNTPTRKFDQPINRYDNRANYVFLYYLSSFYSFTGLEKKIEKKRRWKTEGKKKQMKKKKNRNWETKIMGEK